jgi:hypothetical protein
LSARAEVERLTDERDELLARVADQGAELRATREAYRHRLLGEVPTEFFEGEWHFPAADGPEPWAVITYADKPSPETGHVGWMWWALGEMGDAPTYEAAKRKAEAWIQARMEEEP